jgi:hypothetical protein
MQFDTTEYGILTGSLKNNECKETVLNIVVWGGGTSKKAAVMYIVDRWIENSYCKVSYVKMTVYPVNKTEHSHLFKANTC